MAVDFDKTAEDYGRHRAGFPEGFFERLLAHGVGRPGQAVLDLGTGTGTVARGLAKRGCRVTGLDPSESLLGQARALDEQAGVSVGYVVGEAERSGLPDDEYDAVTAGQCWHWFDRPAASREVRRVLKPGGILAIAHFDWVPLEGNVVRATEELVERHNPDWKMGGGTGLYPAWLADVGDAGFAGIETFSFDLDVPYTREGWRGRMRASAGVAASLSGEAVGRFDSDLARLLAERFPDDPLRVPHRVWAVVCRSPV